MGRGLYRVGAAEKWETTFIKFQRMASYIFVPSYLCALVLDFIPLTQASQLTGQHRVDGRAQWAKESTFKPTVSTLNKSSI